MEFEFGILNYIVGVVFLLFLFVNGVENKQNIGHLQIFNNHTIDGFLDKLVRFVYKALKCRWDCYFCKISGNIAKLFKQQLSLKDEELILIGIIFSFTSKLGLILVIIYSFSVIVYKKMIQNK